MINGILFIDIETVPQSPYLPKDIYDLYCKRFENSTNEPINEHYDDKAGLYAEFGKICCVSVGFMTAGKFYLKSYFGYDEKTILQEVAEKVFGRQDVIWLCGHNSNDFDIPFIYRRFQINGLPIPPILNITGKKPWEYTYYDTMEMWGHMQWKYRTSLDLLAHCLGIPSSKTEMKGSDVAKVYYFTGHDGKDADGSDLLPFDIEDRQKKAIQKISEYCAGDVVTTAQVFCKLRGFAPIRTDQIYVI